LADVNHQSIARNLNIHDYNKAASLVSHSGVTTNTYEQYLKWGSPAKPSITVLSLSSFFQITGKMEAPNKK
jgi:hypothetical protein